MTDYLTVKKPFESKYSIENYLSLSRECSFKIFLFRPLCYVITPKYSVIDLMKNGYQGEFKSLATIFFIRFEFFGCILYDINNYRYYYLDQKATDLMLGKISVYSIKQNELIEYNFLLSLIGLSCSVTKRLKQLIFRNCERDISLNFTAPLKVFLEITSKCNMYCLHCWHNGEKHYSDYTYKELIYLLFELYEIGVIELNITGGEPLEYVYIKKLLRVAKRLFPGMTISTNGKNLIPEISEFLSNLKLHYINISIDGIGEDYQKLRKNCTFEVVDANIKTLRSKMENVGIGVTLNKLNICDVDSFFSYAKNRKLKSINFGVIKPTMRNKYYKHLSIDKDELKSFLSRLEEINKSNYIKYYLSTCFPRIGKTEINLENQCLFNNRSCNCGVLHIKIKANGDVIPCGFLPDSCIVGNVREYSISTLFNKMHFSLNQLDSSICNQCEYFKKKCFGGCKARRYYEKKKFNIVDPLCIKQY